MQGEVLFLLKWMQQYCIGEQKQGMNLQQHKQHDSTIIPLATTQLAAGIVLRQLSSIKVSMWGFF